jgi:hypothetical protein
MYMDGGRMEWVIPVSNDRAPPPGVPPSVYLPRCTSLGVPPSVYPPPLGVPPSMYRKFTFLAGSWVHGGGVV